MARYPCACCGHLTLREGGGGSFDICKVCFWEDEYRDGFRFGPIAFPGEGERDRRSPSNHGLTLREAQANYYWNGVTEWRFKDHVRAPRPDEVPA